MIKSLLKSTFVLFLALAGTATANAADVFNHVRTSPENGGVLNSFFGYATMSFDLIFSENVIIKNAAPAVHLYKGDAATGSEITPDDSWKATIGDNSTDLRVWGADYDGYTYAFPVDDDASYTLTIPAGIVKNAAGAENEDITLTFYGSETATAINNAKTGDKTVQQVFDLNGRQLSTAKKGIGIVRFTDGTTMKITLK
jgi:hypothetical protein